MGTASFLTFIQSWMISIKTQEVISEVQISPSLEPSSGARKPYYNALPGVRSNSMIFDVSVQELLAVVQYLSKNIPAGHNPVLFGDLYDISWTLDCGALNMTSKFATMLVYRSMLFQWCWNFGCMGTCLLSWGRHRT